jgi:hypothetical protein
MSNIHPQTPGVNPEPGKGWLNEAIPQTCRVLRWHVITNQGRIAMRLYTWDRAGRPNIGEARACISKPLQETDHLRAFPPLLAHDSRLTSDVSRLRL